MKRSALFPTIHLVTPVAIRNWTLISKQEGARWYGGEIGGDLVIPAGGGVILTSGLEVVDTTGIAAMSGTLHLYNERLQQDVQVHVNK